MPTTLTNRDIDWYVRPGGSELNGGGFDPYTTNAGTNYCDQDSPQLSLTDLATSGISASVSSVTGGFTSAMIGNVLRIASGTNFTADYYVVTAVADTNNATLDRNCTTGAGSGGVCRLGGAFANVGRSLSTSSASGTRNPVLSTPLLGGHDIYIRGDGTNDPSTNTYDWSDDYWNMPSGGNLSNGNIRFHGYNGRPRIAHRGVLFWNCGWSYAEHIVFFQANATHVAYGPFANARSTAFYDCIFETNGVDGVQVVGGNGANGAAHLLASIVRNSGGGAAGTRIAVYSDHGGCFVFGTWIKSIRGVGKGFSGCYGGIHASLVQSCGSHGVHETEVDASAPIPTVVMNTTIVSNGGHGISMAANAISNCTVVNCIIYGQIAPGTYGINFVDSLKLNTQRYKFVIGYNDYYGNTNGNQNSTGIGLNPAADGAFVGDLTADPGFVNAAGNDFRIGAAVRNMGVIAPYGCLTPAVIDIGGVRG